MCAFFAMTPTFVPYDLRYPLMFQEEQARIQGVFGATAVSIQHFGSSSVPGLGGKPIIDVWVHVRDTTALAAFDAPLQALQYEMRMREDGYVRWDKVNAHGVVTFCMHVALRARDNVVETLLRAPAGRHWLSRYEALKKDLVASTSVMVEYRDGKHVFLSALRQAALLFSSVPTWEKEGCICDAAALQTLHHVVFECPAMAKAVGSLRNCATLEIALGIGCAPDDGTNIDAFLFLWKHVLKPVQ